MSSVSQTRKLGSSVLGVQRSRGTIRTVVKLISLLTYESVKDLLEILNTSNNLDFCSNIV